VVAAVLGGEMHEQLTRRGNDASGAVDVEILLKGAEKLCGVYELPGARERIQALRGRYRNGKSTMAYYEGRVASQAEVLAGLNKDWMEEEEEEDEAQGEEAWTEEDLRREEEDARELERKKRELQARLRAMDKDLGGLMNM
jgi:chromosome segregation ATPase